MVSKDLLLERFLRYVKINTQVVPDAGKIPSSAGQFELAKLVADDLKSAGVKNVTLKENAFIYGTIPENLPKKHPARGKVPVVGFLAHLDTAAEVSGENIKPRIIKKYNGEKIAFSGNPELTLDPSENHVLAECKGHTIITADGTTLLGGDDKAGIAAIVEMAEYFDKHPETLHGKIRICIIADEEVGVGADVLDLKEFGADVAYTVDGGGFGEIDVESFNGFKGKVAVKGIAAFPGYGKGVYLNASKVLSEFITKMDDSLWPENCEKRQPIWWIDEVKGSTADAEMAVYLRNFDLSGIEDQKKLLDNIKTATLKKYPKAKIDINISETYKNYRLELDKDKRVVEYAEEATRRIGLKPIHNYVRGGNDSCHLCFKGLISTNLFIGMDQMHSLREWISLDVMEKAVENLIALAGVWAEKAS
ncbi:MAG: peptidase T [Deltaproteobacteria bacterium]|nr:peptidase T [Deltaproteobacteria bacterium]